MKNQIATLATILYRTEKSAVAMMEKEFKGVPMEPRVAEVYQRKKAAVEKFEAKKKPVSI